MHHGHPSLTYNFGLDISIFNTLLVAQANCFPLVLAQVCFCFISSVIDGSR